MSVSLNLIATSYEEEVEENVWNSENENRVLGAAMGGKGGYVENVVEVELLKEPLLDVNNVEGEGIERHMENMEMVDSSADTCLVVVPEGEESFSHKEVLGAIAECLIDINDDEYQCIAQFQQIGGGTILTNLTGQENGVNNSIYTYPVNQEVAIPTVAVVHPSQHYSNVPPPSTDNEIEAVRMYGYCVPPVVDENLKTYMASTDAGVGAASFNEIFEKEPTDKVPRNTNKDSEPLAQDVKTDKKYKCLQCTFSHKSHSQLQKHAKVHLNLETEWRCTVCGCCFISRKVLRAHATLKEHANEQDATEISARTKRSKKPLINATKRSKSTIATSETAPAKSSNENVKKDRESAASGNHEGPPQNVKFHSKEEGVPIECKLCGNTLNSKLYLRSHLQDTHKVTVAKTLVKLVNEAKAVSQQHGTSENADRNDAVEGYENTVRRSNVEDYENVVRMGTEGEAGSGNIEASEDVQNGEEPSAEFQNGTEASEDVQNGEDSSSECQNHKEASTEFQNGTEAPTDVQNDREASEDVQNNREASADVQNGEDPSAECQNHEEAPAEFQNGTEASADVQNGEDPSAEFQNHKEASADVQNGEDPSAEFQNHKEASTEFQNGTEASAEIPDVDGKEEDGGTGNEMLTKSERSEKISTQQMARRSKLSSKWKFSIDSSIERNSSPDLAQHLPEPSHVKIVFQRPNNADGRSKVGWSRMENNKYIFSDVMPSDAELAALLKNLDGFDSSIHTSNTLERPGILETLLRCGKNTKCESKSGQVETLEREHEQPKNPDKSDNHTCSDEAEVQIENHSQLENRHSENENPEMEGNTINESMETATEQPETPETMHSETAEFLDITMNVDEASVKSQSPSISGEHADNKETRAKVRVEKKKWSPRRHSRRLLCQDRQRRRDTLKRKMELKTEPESQKPKKIKKVFKGKKQEQQSSDLIEAVSERSLPRRRSNQQETPMEESVLISVNRTASVSTRRNVSSTTSATITVANQVSPPRRGSRHQPPTEVVPVSVNKTASVSNRRNASSTTSATITMANEGSLPPRGSRHQPPTEVIPVSVNKTASVNPRNVSFTTSDVIANKSKESTEKKSDGSLYKCPYCFSSTFGKDLFIQHLQSHPQYGNSASKTGEKERKLRSARKGGIPLS